MAPSIEASPKAAPSARCARGPSSGERAKKKRQRADRQAFRLSRSAGVEWGNCLARCSTREVVERPENCAVNALVLPGAEAAGYCPPPGPPIPEV